MSFPSPIALPAIASRDRLAGGVWITGGRVTAWTVIAAAAEAFDTTVVDVIGGSRFAEHARPRFAVYSILRRDLKLSYPEIGRKVGRRDHTTVISGVRRADTLAARDPGFAGRHAAIRARLGLAEQEATDIEKGLV